MPGPSVRRRPLVAVAGMLLIAVSACTRASGVVATPDAGTGISSAPSGPPTSPASPSQPGAVGPDVNRSDRALPPAYLAWQHDGFAPGLATRLSRLHGVERAIVVAGDTRWMTRSGDAAGHTLDAPPSPYRIPIETQAVDPGTFAPFIPTAVRARVTDALRRGLGVLGATSARLRRVGVGGRLAFDGAVTVRVGAIVPDEDVNWSELLVSREVGRKLGGLHDRFALIAYRGAPSDAAVAREVRPLVTSTQPLRVQGPGQPEFRRYADQVWPPVLMKVAFGEFDARPDPAHPGYLQIDPAFVREHLATRTVPLLGSVTCNTKVFGALDSAMRELERRGLASLIHGFSGCYSPRMVLRVPTAPISHHAWGAAVDINAAQNPFGARPNQDPRLVEVMRRWGFAWGGLWTLPDAMHFEYHVPRGRRLRRGSTSGPTARDVLRGRQVSGAVCTCPGAGRRNRPRGLGMPPAA